tara:strand:- start:1591 stop:1887 length:297 start_codon:yes stop_codon:yes gene_type:complete
MGVRNMESMNGQEIFTGEYGIKENADMVNHPPHYNKYGVECIEAIKSATGEGFEYYLQGNVIKYLWRYRYKNGIEDLKKANWYLELMMEVVDNGDKKS